MYIVSTVTLESGKQRYIVLNLRTRHVAADCVRESDAIDHARFMNAYTPSAEDRDWIASDRRNWWSRHTNDAA